MGGHVYVIFCSGLEIQKVQTAVSEHFEILPKFMEAVIVPGFVSKQPLQQQSFSFWFIV